MSPAISRLHTAQKAVLDARLEALSEAIVKSEELRSLLEEISSVDVMAGISQAAAKFAGVLKEHEDNLTMLAQKL